MSLTIDEPAGDQDCSGDGKVCAKGSGAINGSTLAETVYAKIYQPPNQPSEPSNGPPNDAAETTPDSNGDWSFGLLAGADCSSSTPYPDNEIWVWAKFCDPDGSSSSSSSCTYDVASQDFKGKRSAARRVARNRQQYGCYHETKNTVAPRV